MGKSGEGGRYKGKPGVQSKVTAPAGSREETFWFGGDMCGCKSGGEPPHSKLVEGLKRGDRADMGRRNPAPLRRIAGESWARLGG
jgi:hypothetical protein